VFRPCWLFSLGVYAEVNSSTLDLSSNDATTTSFLVTANPASLSLFVTVSPPAYIFYRVACYLFPRNSIAQ
jgi:hypothetical protein